MKNVCHRSPNIIKLENYQNKLIGFCPSILRVRKDIENAARSLYPVLITGETGTGKDVTASLIHRKSGRKPDGFITVNCASYAKEFFESDLFGYVKGAYTGAYLNKPGLALMASGGTLLLNEIGDMSLNIQGRLLRFLDDDQIKPVGSNRYIYCDARVISATNRDLDCAVEAGSFRQDLLYRLKILHIQMPPLRARGDDIQILAEHFLNTESNAINRPNPGLHHSALMLLHDYPWPGNVRELKYAIARAIISNQSDDPLTEKDFSFLQRSMERGRTLELITKRTITNALREEPTKIAAAKRLGIAQSTLYEKIRKYEL